MNKNQRLTRRLLLPISVLMVLPSSGIFAQDNDNDLEELESFTVTGSNIRRVDSEPINPVVTFDTDELKDQGFTSIGDALRSLSFNNGQALTPADSGVSFTPGVSTINLRGLGNNQTLVLINGRRGAPYAAPGFDGLQSVFDINSIPDGAIERIDLLKDGASAIYGSDAVAGVVNVVLKDDFEGINVTAQIGDYFDTSAFFQKATATVGTTSDKTSILVSIAAESQEAVFNRDLGFSSNADQTDRAHKADPYWVISGLETTPFATDEEYLDWFDGTSNPVEAGWFDNRSSRGFPGYFTVSRPDVTYSPALDEDNNQMMSGDSPLYIKDATPVGFPVQPGFGGLTTASFYSERVTYDGGTESPMPGDLAYGYNPYNYQEASGLFPEYKRYSFYTRAKHEFTDYLYGVLEVSFSRTDSKVYAAATPVDIQTSRGLDSADAMYVPYIIPYDYDDDGIEYADDLTPGQGFVNPYNPFGADITNGNRRMVEFPARLSDVRSDAPRVVAVLGGEIDILEGFNWEVGYNYSESTVNVINVAAQDSKLQQAFFGLTRLGDGSLTWDPNTLPEERVYFNWFGINEDAMVDYITIENPQSANFEMVSYDFKVDGSVVELPAGPLGVAIGAEHRTEDWQNIKTELNATSDILGGSEGTSSFGARKLTSVFAEVVVPIHEMLEVQLAGRYEDYSDDGFKDDIRPKVAVKIQPTDWISFRASYSESFKAPDLAYLYTASQTSFTSSQIIDPVTSSEIDQLQIVTAGNPELDAETSKNYYYGVTFEPGQSLFNGLLDGFVLSVEYFTFDRENMLAQLSDFYGYSDFIQGEYDGDPLFAGKVLRDSLTNEVLYIRDDYANISSSEYKGLDVSISYVVQTADFGNYYFNWSTTWLDELTLDGSDLVGSWLTPEYRHTASLRWLNGDWSAAIFGSYIDDRLRNPWGGGGYAGDETIDLYYTVKSQWIFNVSASFSGIADTEITVGINNVFNEEPPADPWEGLGATGGVNYLQPAFGYIRVDRSF